MKQSKKTLALLVVLALAITAIFALTACTQDPTVESITVEIIGGGNEIALTSQNATADAIKGKIKVTANLSDETEKEVEAKDYTLEGFDATKLNVAQTVTVKYGELTKTVSVKVTGTTLVVVTVTSIEVTIKAADATRVELAAADATEPNLKAAITVKTVKSDNTKTEVTDYELEGFVDSKVGEEQTVTIKHSNKTATVKVFIEAAPVAEYKVFAIVNSNEAGKTELVKGEDGKFVATITLTKDDVVVLKNSDDETINVEEAEQYKAAKMGDYTFTVADETATAATVAVEEYTVTVTVKHQGAEDKLVATTEGKDFGAPQFAATGVELQEGDVVVITDSKDNTFTWENDAFDGTATQNIICDFYAKANTQKVWVKVTVPMGETVVTITVGEDVYDCEPNPKNVAEYMYQDLELKEGDEVVITMDGTVVSNYNLDCGFAGTAIRDGKYSFYIGTASIWVVVPAAPIDPSETDKLAITVNGNKAECTIKPNGAQYEVSIALHAGDVIDIKLDGEDFNKFQDNHISTTIAIPGTYTMYVKPAENQIWVVVPKVESVELFVGETKKVDLALKSDSNNEWEIASVELAADDVVTIKVNGEAYAVYKNSDTFSGTVTVAGTHSFYVKLLNANDLGIWTVVPSAE